MKTFEQFLQESFQFIRKYKLTSYYDELDKLNERYNDLCKTDNSYYSNYYNNVIKEKRKKEQSILQKKVYDLLQPSDDTEENPIGIGDAPTWTSDKKIINLVYPGLLASEGHVNLEFFGETLIASTLPYTYSADSINFKGRKMMICSSAMKSISDDGNDIEVDDEEFMLYVTPSLFLQDLIKSGCAEEVLKDPDNFNMLANCMEIENDELATILKNHRGAIKMSKYNI